MTATSQRRSVIAAVLALALAMGMLVAGAISGGSTAHAADASVCDVSKKVYCDGIDEADPWDGYDDRDCTPIPGVRWDGDTGLPVYKNGRPDYSGVKGKVYWYDGSQYKLVHDSTPKPKKKADKKPAATSTKSNGSGSAKSGSGKKTADAAKPAVPDTAAEAPVAEAPAAPAPVIGEVSVSGVLVAGGTVTITGTGFAPDTSGYRIEVHSDPTILAEATSDSAGAFSATVSLPDTLPAGEHTVRVFLGTDAVGEAEVAVAARAANDPLVGILLIGGLVVGGGAAALVATRKRKKAGASEA